MWLFLQEAKDTKLIEAKIFTSHNGTGVAVLTSSYRIFLVNSIKEPKVRRLAEVPSKCFAWVHMMWNFDIMKHWCTEWEVWNVMACMSFKNKEAWTRMVSWICSLEKIYVYVHIYIYWMEPKKYVLVTSEFL